MNALKPILFVFVMLMIGMLTGILVDQVGSENGQGKQQADTYLSSPSIVVIRQIIHTEPQNQQLGNPR